MRWCSKWHACMMNKAAANADLPIRLRTRVQSIHYLFFFSLSLSPNFSWTLFLHSWNSCFWETFLFSTNPKCFSKTFCDGWKHAYLKGHPTCSHSVTFRKSFRSNRLRIEADFLRTFQRNISFYFQFIGPHCFAHRKTNKHERNHQTTRSPEFLLLTRQKKTTKRLINS